MEISQGEVVSNTVRLFPRSSSREFHAHKKSEIKETYDGVKEDKKSWTRFDDEKRDESAISMISCSLSAKLELEHENVPVQCCLPAVIKTMFINFYLSKVSSSVEKIMTLYYFGPIYNCCLFHFFSSTSIPKAV